MQIPPLKMQRAYVLMDAMSRLSGPSRALEVSNNGSALAKKGRRSSTRQRMALQMKGMYDSDVDPDGLGPRGRRCSGTFA